MDIAKILRKCPKGMYMYCPLFGLVALDFVTDYDCEYPINVEYETEDFCMHSVCFTKDGKCKNPKSTECVLFPSLEIRDWRKFKIPK